MIIGISGLIGSGKNSVANRLSARWGYKQYSWATPLKDITSILFGWDRDMLEGSTVDSRAAREEQDEWWSKHLNKPWSPRIALQQLGTEVFRESLNQDIWILSGMKKLQNAGNVVIPDTRFPNEINAIKSMGGQTWHVRRGEYPIWWKELSEFKRNLYRTSAEISEFMQLNYPNVHASEYSWHGTKFDFIISNDKSLDELYKTVDSLFDNQTGPAA